MKKLIVILTLLFLSAQIAHAQKMTVKDSDTNILMEINDEGTTGSITLPSGSAPGGAHHRGPDSGQRLAQW